MLIGEPLRTKNFMENALGIWATTVEMNKDLAALKQPSFLKKPALKQLIRLAEAKLAAKTITRQPVKIKTEEGYDEIEINRMKSTSPLVKLEISSEENSKLGIFQKRGIIDDIRRIERNTLFVNAVFYISDNFYIQENLETLTLGGTTEPFYTVRGNNKPETISEYGEVLFYYNKNKFYFSPVFAYLLAIYNFNEIPEGAAPFVEALQKLQELLKKKATEIPAAQNSGARLFEQLKKKEALGVTDLVPNSDSFLMNERYHICLDYCLSDCYEAEYGKDEAFLEEEQNVMLSKEKFALDAYYGASPSFELADRVAQYRDMTLLLNATESFEILAKMILKVETAGNAHAIEFFDRTTTEFERAWNTLSKINAAIKSLS